MNLFSIIVYWLGYWSLSVTQLIVVILYSAINHPPPPPIKMWKLKKAGVRGPFLKVKDLFVRHFNTNPKLMVQEYSFAGMAPILLHSKKPSWQSTIFIRFTAYLRISTHFELAQTLKAQKVNERLPSNKSPPRPLPTKYISVLAQREVRGVSVVFQNWF